MNGCNSIQAKFSEYLDGRLTGHEMQRIAAHLDDVPRCAQANGPQLKQTQMSLAQLGPVPEPEDLLLRIRVAVSQERARSRKGVLQTLEAGLEQHHRPVPAAGRGGLCQRGSPAGHGHSAGGDGYPPRSCSSP